MARGEHPGPGGDPEATLDATPRHRPRGIGMDAPAAHPPVCLRGATAEQPYPPVSLQGATAEQPYPPMPTPCPNWPRLLTSHPMPGPATLVGEWPRKKWREGMYEPLWFAAYPRTLQQVGEAAHGWKWDWPVGKTPEVRVSPLVHAFWEETGADLTMACVKLCWEPAPRGIFCKREEGPVAYVITFIDELAIRVSSLDAWDQFVWLLATAMPQALTEAEPYGYCHGQAVDLGPVMLAAQLRVTDEAGTYLCAAWALVFEGSVLAYNPTRDEAEWVPMHSLASDLTWAEERSTMALANYVPCVSQEAAWIARLRAHQLVSWPADSSTSEEEEEEQEEADPEPPITEAELERGKEDEEEIRQADQEDEQEPNSQQCS